MTASELFQDPPQVWGLRGDSSLWAALARRLNDVAMPESVEDLVMLLAREFRDVTGTSFTADRDVCVEEFAHGGMSSGYVSLSFWRETAIPLVVERLRCLKAGIVSVRHCQECCQILPADCFRKGSKRCVWCAYEPKERRANARYSDKAKGAAPRLNIDPEAFVRWYVAESDNCDYCKLNYRELRELRLRRGGGYTVSWDIDRKDSARPYEEGNIALSCFVCNMAKCDVLSANEAMIVGEAVRMVWDRRLSTARRDRDQRAASVAELIAAAGRSFADRSCDDGR